MKIKNIIFAFPTQAVLRADIFATACRELKRSYGFNVVLTYNGPIIEGIDDVNSEHFETWLNENKGSVEKLCFQDLEKKYPKSNFWQPAMIERNLTNYSYLGRTLAKSCYGIEEIEVYLKALVLFYEHVIETHRIQAIFNIVSDNIHSRILYELSRSLSIVPLSIGRGIYWFDETFYPNTGLNFGSKILDAKYEKLCETNGREAGNDPNPHDIYLKLMKDNGADKVRPAIIYPKTLTTTLKNALKAIKGNYQFMTIRKPTITESNFKIHIVPAFLSFIARMYNIGWIRHHVTNRSIPTAPYVLFPLHYQPEATILGASPGWTDQLALVRLLSVSLPSGFRLVVKDHPVIGGIRKPEFYRAIMNLPNVVLLDDRLSIRSVMSHPNCRILVTIGGTAGLEGMLFGKPLLIFGQSYYDSMRTLIRPPANLNEMPYFMKELLIQEKYSSTEEILKDAETFMLAWLSIVKPVGQAMPEPITSRAEAGKDWARVANELIIQIEESGLYTIRPVA